MANAPTFDIGDQVRSSASFRNAGGTAADPTGVKFLHAEPDGTETTYVFGVDGEVVQDSTGEFHFDVIAAAAGRHVVRSVGSGVVAAAQERPFIVRESVFTTPT